MILWINTTSPHRITTFLANQQSSPTSSPTFLSTFSYFPTLKLWYHPDPDPFTITLESSMNHFKSSHSQLPTSSLLPHLPKSYPTFLVLQYITWVNQLVWYIGVRMNQWAIELDWRQVLRGFGTMFKITITFFLCYVNIGYDIMHNVGYVI